MILPLQALAKTQAEAGVLQTLFASTLVRMSSETDGQDEQRAEKPTFAADRA